MNTLGTRIGRRVYYDVITGVVILLTEEAEGNIIERTVEQDFNDFYALNSRERSSFDYIQLEFGQYSRDFQEASGYRVDVKTRQLEFSYPDPSNPSAPPIFRIPLSVEVERLKQEDLNNKEAIAELYLMLMGGI